MTLLELIVVMAILSALFGIGIGVFRSLATPDRLATADLKDAFRQARLFALRERAPASVVVDPEAGEVFALGLRTVGNWHFEDAAGTGWPMAADHDGAEIVPGGAIGYALQLDDDDRLVLDPPSASFDSPHGFGVEVYVNPATDPRPMVLLERAGSWAIRLDRDDQLEVRLLLETDQEPEESAHTIEGGFLPTGRMTHLMVVFDGRELHVEIDGVAAVHDTRFATTRRLVRAPGEPIVSGEAVNAFRGRLDELRLASVVLGTRRPLPPETTLEGKRRLLHLDAFGHLDPADHVAAEVVTFLHGDPAKRSGVEFGLLGTTRVWHEAME